MIKSFKPRSSSTFLWMECGGADSMTIKTAGEGKAKRGCKQDLFQQPMQVVDCMRLNTAKGQAFPLHLNDPLGCIGEVLKMHAECWRLYSAGQPAHTLISSLIHSNLTFLRWLSLTCVPVLFIGYQHLTNYRGRSRAAAGRKMDYS